MSGYPDEMLPEVVRSPSGGLLFGIIVDEAFAIIYTRTYGETVNGYNDEWAEVWTEYDRVYRPVAMAG